MTIQLRGTKRPRKIAPQYGTKRPGEIAPQHGTKRPEKRVADHIRDIVPKGMALCLIFIFSFQLTACGNLNNSNGNSTDHEKSSLELATTKDSARWIWTAQEENNSWVELEKTFSCGDIPDQAKLVAEIATDSKYRLTINGKVAVFEGGLKRGRDLNSTYYDRVDLTDYFIPNQENIILIEAVYWGESVANGYHTSGSAGVIFRMELPDGQWVCSDDSWIARVHPYMECPGDTGGVANRYPEIDVLYNANIDEENFPWGEAVEKGAWGEEPWGEMIERPLPMFYWSEDILDYVDSAKYAGKVLSQDETIEVSLPANVQFVPYFQLKTAEGQKIRVYSDDYEDHNGNSVQLIYTTKEGEQEFESPGWMNGDKVYYELPAGTEITRLGYRLTGYDVKRVGSFETDDEFLNTLWKMASQTIAVNMRDTFMDCPNRERTQWAADLALEMTVAMYDMDSSAGALYEEGIRHTIGSWDGKGVPAVVTPQNVELDTIPLQCLILLSSLNDYVTMSGNIEFAEEVYPDLVKILAVWEVGEDGLIHCTDTDKVWSWADSTGGACYALEENEWYALALESTIGLGKLLGQDEDVKKYQKTKDGILDAINQNYWTEDGYTDGSMSPDERDNALAILAGATDDAKREVIMNLLAEFKPLDPSGNDATTIEKVNEVNERLATPLFEYYIEKACFEAGRSDIAEARMRDRYQYMVSGEYTNQKTTLWEYWYHAQGTNCHGWASGPLALMSSYMAGIRPTAPGYETYEIRPDLGSRNQLHAVVPTPGGEIRLEVEKNETEYVVDAEYAEMEVKSTGKPMTSKAVGEGLTEKSSGESPVGTLCLTAEELAGRNLILNGKKIEENKKDNLLQVEIP